MSGSFPGLDAAVELDILYNINPMKARPLVTTSGRIQRVAEAEPTGGERRRPAIGHRTRAEAAADELRRRILDGEFPEGFQLRQDALAAEFGISRIPIREALVQLEAEGLVKSHPHRGAVVSALSAAEIEELYELRALLEPRLLARSAPRLTPDDYRAIDGILAEYSAELRADRVDRWGELNTALHGLLYRHAEQSRTAAIVATLLQNADRYTRMHIAFTKGRARAEREHAEIVDLCRKGQVEAACRALEAHVRNAGAQLGAFLRRREPMMASKTDATRT
jgi:DNA-binding GntR family transcriptional regulator